MPRLLPHQAASPRVWGSAHWCLVYTRKDSPGGETCTGPACKLGHLGREYWGTRYLEKDLEDWAFPLALGGRTQLEKDQSEASKSQSPGHRACGLGVRAAWNLLCFKSQ